MSKPDVSAPELAEVEARMRPGRFSQAGFLGPNEKLRDVLAQDAQTVAQLGLTFEQLADALENLLQPANAARGRTVRVPPHFEVRVTAYTGFQICPWAPDPHHAQCTEGGGVRFGSLDWEIRNLGTKQSMHGPGLIVHLIRAHHFFEGFESLYRVDPRQLAELLEISAKSAK